LTLIALLAVLADLLPLHDYVSQATTPNLGPNWSREFLGSDSIGRSMLTRIIVGARTSFLIGVCATLLSMVVGGTLGLVSAYFGGALRSMVEVLANSVLAIPSLLFLLAVSIALQPDIGLLIVLLSVTTVPAFMRLTYANALAEMNKDYVVAVHLMGGSSSRVMFREVLPNVIMPVLSYAVLVVPAMMIVEGSLSFLGFGVKPPRPSWGAMISAGKIRLETNAWEAMTPGIVLFVTVYALNRVGDLARERYGSREGTS
jgi:peptide/nickel transport system permease protein